MKDKVQILIEKNTMEIIIKIREDLYYTLPQCMLSLLSLIIGLFVLIVQFISMKFYLLLLIIYLPLLLFGVYQLFDSLILTFGEEKIILDNQNKIMINELLLFGLDIQHRKYGYEKIKCFFIEAIPSFYHQYSECVKKQCSFEYDGKTIRFGFFNDKDWIEVKNLVLTMNDFIKPDSKKGKVINQRKLVRK